MSALIKQGTENNDNLTISNKGASSYAYQIYGRGGNDILAGGLMNDFISGGAGNDTLSGGRGNDTLSGGIGKDIFIFDTVLDATKNLDQISDFSITDDKIQLDVSVFSVLSTGILPQDILKIGTAPADANDYLVYNPTTGILSYDADGNNSGATSVALTKLSPNLALTPSHFIIKLPDVITKLLEEVGSFSSYQDTYTTRPSQWIPDTKIPFIASAMNSLFSTVLGNQAFAINHLNVATNGGSSLSVSGSLNSSSRISLILGNSVALDYLVAHASDADTLVPSMALDYLISSHLDLGTFFPGIALLQGLGLSNVEFVANTDDITVNNPTLGATDLATGFNLLGVVDFTASSNPMFHFISQTLGVANLAALVNISPEEGVSIDGQINTRINVITIKSLIPGDNNFSVIETQMALKVAVDAEMIPSITASNTVELRGYDPTQGNEPVLTLSGGFIFEPLSVSAFFASNSVSAWKNPYSFSNAEIRNVAFQIGMSYTGEPSNVGFIADLTWGVYDVNLGVSVDVLDPTRDAFTFTLNKEINFLPLMAQMGTMSMGSAAVKLIDLTKPLLQYIPITLVSFDSDKDGKLNPLVSFVPFPTTIANQSLEEGMSINAQVNLAGVIGTLALQSDPDFTSMTGSLVIKTFKLGDWLSISGTQPGTDLTANFLISPYNQYFNGDGKITLFGQTMLQAHFEISPIEIAITNTQIGMDALLSLHINSVKTNLLNLNASGSADVVLFSHKTAGVSFSISPQEVDFKAYIDLGDLNINGSFAWHTVSPSLNVTGDGSITAFGQALTTAHYTLSPDQVSITNTQFGLGSILSFNVTQLGVDLIKHSASGTASIMLLGHPTASTTFNMTSQQVDFRTYIDLGDLNINGGFIWNTPTQILTGDGDISLFSQKLAATHYTISPNQVSIDKTQFGLGGVLSFNVNNATVNLVNHSGVGQANISLFSYTAANASFNINSNNVYFYANMDLGYLDVAGNFNWTNQSQALQITGSVSINNQALTNSTLSYQGNTLAVAGIVSVPIPAISSTAINATIGGSMTNGILSSISVDADIPKLGHFGFQLAPDQFAVTKITDTLTSKANAIIGELAAYVANNVATAATDVLNSGIYTYTTAQAGKVVGNVARVFNGLFGSHPETNQTFVGVGVVDDRRDLNGGNDQFWGNDGNDWCDGHQGNDILDGGNGNDNLNGGSNEDLLNGGDGNDTLKGDSGADTLYGGFGDDLIYGYEPHSDPAYGAALRGDNNDGSDQIHAGPGNDTVYGCNFSDIIYGDGGDDVLYESNNSQDDASADTLIGGVGNDTYTLVNAATTTVIENPDEGTDLVRTWQSYTLPANVENLTAVTTQPINLSGNELNNTLTGNASNGWLMGFWGADNLFGGAGADTLDGGAGTDYLSGGVGADSFQFADIFGGYDSIVDFSVGELDNILLHHNTFTRLTALGALNVAYFIKGAAAADSNDYVVYNPATGGLFYDADGNGGGTPIQIALMGTNLALTSQNFTVV